MLVVILKPNEMQHRIDTTEIEKDERVSKIGGRANIDTEFYPICPITKKPMLLLLTLRKDIFDTAYRQNNNKLENENFCVSVFVSAKIHMEYGIGGGMPRMYTINQLSECEKMTNGTVKVLLHKDIDFPAELPDLPIEIPARKIVLTKMTKEEIADDTPEHREWYEGSILQISKFGTLFPAWLQEPINFKPEIILNQMAKIFKPSFGPKFILQIGDELISKHSKIHSGLLGTDGMGYLFLPGVMRNWINKHENPIEIGNFFTQDT